MRHSSHPVDWRSQFWQSKQKQKSPFENDHYCFEAIFLFTSDNEVFGVRLSDGDNSILKYPKRCPRVPILRWLTNVDKQTLVDELDFYTVECFKLWKLSNLVVLFVVWSSYCYFRIWIQFYWYAKNVYGIEQLLKNLHKQCCYALLAAH